jgi:hypothetical protein
LYFSQLSSLCVLNTYTHQSVITASQANEGASGSKDKKKSHWQRNFVDGFTAGVEKSRMRGHLGN